MKKTLSIIFISVIILACSMPLVLQVLGIRTPSVEKRALTAAPSLLSSDNQVNLAYTSDLDSFIADNFPLRPWLISAWHQLNIRLLGQSGNAQVVLGRDGWLFFEKTVPSYLSQDALSDAEYRRLDTILRLQHEYLDSNGIKMMYTVVPNKNTVYPSRMPPRYANRTETNALAQLASHLTTPGYVDLRASLIDAAAKSEQPLYHLSDSHWNNRGALMALDEILQKAGDLLMADLASGFQSADYTETADWQGDLATMLFPSGPPPDIQQSYDIAPDFRYTRPLRSLEDMQIITKSERNSFTALVFRDSFANALIPMLSDAMGQVAYSRAIPYNYTLLDETDTDLVLLEIVERNLSVWLTQPPKMPAIAWKGDRPARISAQGSLEAEVSKDGGFLKIAGKVTSDSLSTDWNRVVVKADGHLYEAFPVAAADSPNAAGFVLYLRSEEFESNNLPIEVFVENGDEWIYAAS